MHGRSLLALVAALLLFGSTARAASFVVRVDAGSPDRPRVVFAPRAAEEAVMVIAFDVGAADDGMKSGLTRLSQRMLLDGNAREPRAALWRAAHLAAADLELTTEMRRSTFRLRAHKATFDALAERLLEAVFQPKLDKRQLANVKRLTRADRLPSGSLEDTLAHLLGTLLAAGEGDASERSYANDPHGDPEEIARLTLDEVEAHLRAHFSPANATVTLAGAFDEARLGRKLASFRGGTRAKTTRVDPTSLLPQSLARDAVREAIVQAHVLSLETPEQAAAARLLSAFLEERLAAALRAKGLASRPRAFVLRRPSLDLLVLYVPVPQGQGGRVDAELRALFASLRDGSFASGAFERNRAYALASLERDDEEPSRLARALDGHGRVVWHAAAVRGALEGMAQAVFLSNVRPWLDDTRTVRARYAPGARAEEPR